MKNLGFCKIHNYEQQYTLNSTTPPCYIRYGGSVLRDEVILDGCDGMTLMITTMKYLSNLIISIENITNMKSYESIFNVKNEPSKMLVLALNKWAEIMNYELPPNMQRIVLTAEMEKSGNNGILGGVIIKEVQFINDRYVVPLEAYLSLNMSYDVQLGTVIHEVGHVLGIGTLWEDNKHLLTDVDGEGRFYIGEHALNAYKQYVKESGFENVYGIPVEDNGGEGTANVHPEEGDSHAISSTDDRSYKDIFHPGLGNEVMSGVYDENDKLSKISIGFLHDLGYNVNYNLAEEFVIEHLYAIDDTKEHISEPGGSQDFLLGDVNNDGVFNAADVVFTASYLAKISEYVQKANDDPLFHQRADVNQDGKETDSADVVYMASSLAKIPGYKNEKG